MPCCAQGDTYRVMNVITRKIAFLHEKARYNTELVASTRVEVRKNHITEEYALPTIRYHAEIARQYKNHKIHLEQILDDIKMEVAD